MTLLAVAYLLFAVEGAHQGTEQPQGRAQSAPSEQQEGRQPAAENERLICRRVGQAATGSSLGGDRRCLTAEQWRALNRRR